MCRYSYSSGACANRHVESLKCIGEENCVHSQTNVMLKRGHTSRTGDCGIDKWLGLYCEKHGRFFCPGRDGCAASDKHAKDFGAQTRFLSRRLEEG